MITIEAIGASAEKHLEGTALFLVAVKCSPANEIEVLVDSDTAVSIDECITLSRQIEADFDREVEDFELTVASAGVGQPLQLLRQYLKNRGKEVEVVFKSGGKLSGVLVDADADSVTISYSEKVTVPGKKRKQLQETVQKFQLETIKTTKSIVKFK